MTRGRRASRRGVRLGLAVGIALLALPSVPAHADDEEIPHGLSFTLTTYGPDVLGRAPLLVATASVGNPGLAPVAGLEFVLAMTVDPLTERADLAAWADGDLDVATRDVVQTAVGTDGLLPGGTTESTTVVATSDRLSVSTDATAVYGVELRLEYEGIPLTVDRTFVTTNGGDLPPSPVSIIVVASGSPERVDALATAAAVADIAFAVDPTALSREALATLSLPDAYVLPAYNFDVPSFARGGGSVLLDRALETARAAGTLPGSAPWLAIATDIDRPTVELATSRGASLVLSLPFFAQGAPDLSGYAGGVPPAFASVAEADDEAPLIVLPDAYLSLALAAGRPNDPTATARIVAETALLARDNTADNPVVVVAGPSWSVNPDGPADTLLALLTSPWVEPVALHDAVAAATPATLTLSASTPLESDVPTSLVTSTGSAIRGLDALAAATDDPDAIEAPLIDALLRAFSFDERFDAEARNEAISEAISAIAETRAKVRIPEGSSFNLISKTGNLPVTVTNDLDHEVTVDVVIESETPILRIDDHPLVVVPPQTSVQVLVPVTAISSGNADVRIGLQNPMGDRITPVTSVRMRIHAQWGTVFTASLAALLVLLLVGGTIRTARRARNDRRRDVDAPSPTPRRRGGAR